MVSNSSFQCIQSSNSANLQTFKLPNYLTLNISNIRTLRFSSFQTFEVRKLQTFNPRKFETLRAFKLWSFQTFKLPGSQTFKLQALKLSNSNPKAARWASSRLQRSFALLLHATRVAAASNFQAGFLFKLSNSRLRPTFKLDTFKLSNLAQHVIRSNSQKFEFEKPHSWHLSFWFRV